jgi:ATP-dependent exoDNAse (exonuclease V) alpha subunit
VHWYDPVDEALATRTLSEEQRDLVTRLCLGDEGVVVVAAAAGTGKTTALAAAREAWQGAGRIVLGAAVAARAARQLEAASEIPACTLTRLTKDLEEGRLRLNGSHVVVIDEAGMAGTRQLAPVLDAAEAAGAKVVLVGDPRQLPEIDAGGLLSALDRMLDGAILTQNRRQVEPWEQVALDELRSGSVQRALDAFEAHGRLVTAGGAIEVRQQMADDWFAARSRGEDVAMVAIRRSDVDDLNGRARRHLEAHGEVSGPVLTIEDRPYQAGDEIVCLRNGYRVDVRNGDRCVVEQVDVDRRALLVKMENGRRVLPAAYLDAGHVAHGYATTIHKAQGMTVDRCLVLGTDDLYREAGYVALSRGRVANVLYAVGSRGIDRDLTHAPQRTAPEPVDAVRDAIRREASKQLAIERIELDREALQRVISPPSGRGLGLGL